MKHPLKIAGMIAATAALAVPQAAATVTHREQSTETFEFSGEPCGIPLDVVMTWSSRLVVREDADGAARTKDTYSFEAVFTNPENDRWFVQRGHGVVNQIKATPLEGSLYEIVVADAGQPFVLEDSEGRVVLRDRGVVRRTLLFDLEAGEHAETDALAHGPHPSSDGDAVCAAMAELAGV